MTKADHIRALYATGKSTSEIAAMIGCETSYVRVCARQRVPGGHNADIAYQARMRKAAIKWGDRTAAARANRVAYRAARDRGLDSFRASSLAGSAYGVTLRQTALLALRKAAQGD